MKLFKLIRKKKSKGSFIVNNINRVLKYFGPLLISYNNVYLTTLSKTVPFILKSLKNNVKSHGSCDHLLLFPFYND